MSHIPQAKTGLSLKPTNKILKPIQGGGGTATSPSNSTAGVVKPRGTPAAKPAATPGTSKTPPSGGKSAGAGSVVKPRGSTSTTGAMVSPRGSVFLGGTSATPNAQQQQPKFSRENSATRLQYRREGSSSSLHSTGSESAGSIVRRRGSSQSQQGATSAADLKKFFSIGDRVLVSGAKPGAIAFIGDAQFAKGDWAGVILDEPTGKNSGTVAGVRYFDCKPLHGVFTKLEKITKINKVSETLHSEGPSTALEIGDRVVVSNTKIGTVRYVGTTGFAKGDWAGIELDEPLGKNDGAVAGTRYFRCQQEYGLFAPIHKVIKTGKKESTKLLTSPPPMPPQLSETSINSLSNSVPKTSRENSISSPELTPLSLSSASTLVQKVEETGDISQVSPAKTPSAHVSLQVVALQEALEDRERQIQTLLEERDFERNEVASATSQASTAEEELVNVTKKHEKAIVESNKSIDALKSLVELAEKDKAELSLQIEEEKRKNEDLLFKLEEEEITLGDELKTEENQIKELKQKLQENQHSLSRMSDELEKTKTDKSDSDKKVDDMEFQLLESNQEMSSIQLQLEESQTKVKELEKNLSSLEEKHTAQCSEASRGRKEQLERIAQLEEDISSRNNRCKELEVQLQNANTELRKAQEENETLKPQIEDLTSKLYSKENEFASMSDELKHIKAATLELQKQLQLSEAKSYNLTTDKTKLENEIAELMKSSGNNSERLTYLNGQLREKDRLIDEIKTSLAEAEADAGLLTGEIAQAKESYASDVDKLTKSHDEQIKKLTNQINSLKTEVERNKDEHAKLVQVHKSELENIERAKNEEIAALSTQIDEKADQFRKLSEEYDTIKTQLLTTMQERDSVKEKCSSFESQIQSKQNELREVSLQLEAAVDERGVLTSAQGDTDKKVTEVLEKYDHLNTQHQALLQEKGETVKLCHEKENQVKKLNLEKDAILQEKNATQAKLDKLQEQHSVLENEITGIKAQSSQKEKELMQLTSSANDGVSQISQLQSQLEQIKSERDRFNSKIVLLEEQSTLQQEQIKSLNQERTDADNGKIEMNQALLLAQDEIRSLNSRLEERDIDSNKAAEAMNVSMENDLKATKHELKRKNEELLKYKQQVLDLKKQIATTGVQQSTNQESQGNADLAVKLVETEDLLEATQAEKENLDAQVEFLNSVIVDLQRKNEENEQRIELLMTGGSQPNGLLDSPEMDDETPIPRHKVRLFCDICDVFDEHDTDDCPTQASDPQDVGTMHHGSRTEPRPYCTTCEVFGHWTQDCDDEETF